MGHDGDESRSYIYITKNNYFHPKEKAEKNDRTDTSFIFDHENVALAAKNE